MSLLHDIKYLSIKKHGELHKPRDFYEIWENKVNSPRFGRDTSARIRVLQPGDSRELRRQEYLIRLQLIEIAINKINTMILNFSKPEPQHSCKHGSYEKNHGQSPKIACCKPSAKDRLTNRQTNQPTNQPTNQQSCL